MSQKWFNGINLQQNQLENAVIQNLASDPSSGRAGQIYYNTADKGYKYYNGTAWVGISADAVKSIVAGNGLTSSGTDTVTISLGTPSSSGSGSNTFGSNGLTATSHTHQISLPDASTTAKGVIEIVTDAEATTGTDTTRAINAKQLETARTSASVTVTAGNGLGGGGTGNSMTILLGTPSTITQSTTNNVTPNSHTHALSFTEVPSPTASGNEISFIDTVSQGANGGITATKKTVRSASTTQTGVVELATQDEVNTGTDTTRVVTAATLGKGKANGVASLDENSKIVSSQLPDYLLGQVMYGGNASTVATTTVVSPSASLKTKKNITTASISIENSETSTKNNTYGYKDMEGVYFICQASGTFAGNSFEKGDWIISTGAKWEKIDNTDAVKSVNGKTGAVVLNALTINSKTVNNIDTSFAFDGSAARSMTFDGTDFASDSSNNFSLRATGVVAGTYNSVSVNEKGRVIAGQSFLYCQQVVKILVPTAGTVSYDIPHELGTDVTVQVYLTNQTDGADTMDELIMVDVLTKNNLVRLKFGIAPSASDRFKVVITGVGTTVVLAREMNVVFPGVNTTVLVGTQMPGGTYSYSTQEDSSVSGLGDYSSCEINGTTIGANYTLIETAEGPTVVSRYAKFANGVLTLRTNVSREVSSQGPQKLVAASKEMVATLRR